MTEVHDVAGGNLPPERHGTGVTAVIGAARNNGIGIVGVAPEAEIAVYRACWERDDGVAYCNTLTLSRALEHMQRKPPDIVNLSLSGPADPLLARLLDRLLAAGTYVVTAFDEGRPAAERFPRPREGVFVAHSSVGAPEAPGAPVYLPGQSILTAQPGHSYDFMSGHSFAAAHLSGVLALMLEANPRASYAALAQALNTSHKTRDGMLSVDACSARQPDPRSRRLRTLTGCRRANGKAPIHKLATLSGAFHEYEGCACAARPTGGWAFQTQKPRL